MAFTQGQFARNIVPEAPAGLLPPEIENWLYENFRTLQYAVLAPIKALTHIEVRNSTTETEIVNLPFPPDSLPSVLTGEIEIGGGVGFQASSHTATFRLYLNSDLIETLVLSAGGSAPTNAGWSVKFRGMMEADGVNGIFHHYTQGFLHTESVAGVHDIDHPIDTTVANNWRVTVQLSVAHADTFVKNHFVTFKVYDGDSL